MPNYKDTNNTVHFLDDAAFEHLLPSGCVLITDEEAAELNPLPPIVIPPISVTPWQIRKALNATGMREAVEAFVAVADQDTRDGWDRATEFREDDPLLIAAAEALNADLHALLSLAVTL